MEPTAGPPAPAPSRPLGGQRVLGLVATCRAADAAADLAATAAGRWPDLVVACLVVDAGRAPLVEPARLGRQLTPVDLGLDDAALHRLALVHDEDGLVDELARRLATSLGAPPPRPAPGAEALADLLGDLFDRDGGAAGEDTSLVVDARPPGERATGPQAAVPYGWARSASGLPLTATVRSLARRTLERPGDRPPPSPWEGDGSSFTAWLAEVDPEVGHAVSRFVHEVWRGRPEAQARFGEVSDLGFRRWASFDPPLLEAEPAELLPPLRYDGRAPLPGVNLVGYFRGDFGVGEAGRMVARALAASGLPLSTTTITPAVQRHGSRFLDTGLDAAFDLNLLAVNPGGLLEVARDPSFTDLLAGRPNVGLWYWEVDVLPGELLGAFDLVDEVWCASRYLVEVFSPLTAKPVRQHPLVVRLPDARPRLTRSDLGLPEGRFLFGFAFDHLSVLDRKNPRGVVEAYLAAFGPDDGAALVLKSINGERFPEAAAELDDLVAGRPDVVQARRHLSGVEMRALLANLDAFVSLHRSEGLGLGMLDAMALGTPVMATAHSGNMTFMDEHTAALVPFELVEVGPGREPYPAHAHWAEPDLDAAAAALRALAADPAAARALGQRARRAVAAHDRATAGRWFAERHRELRP